MNTIRFAALVAALLLAAPRAAVRADARVGSDAVPISTANMPPGWQWPPTPAMRAAGERCLQALSAAGVAYQQPLRALGKIATPVVVPGMTFAGLSVRQVYAQRAPIMDCHMALALVQHAGLLTELGVEELIVAGFYQNRRARLRGRSVALLSRHALGLAVDIRAFRLGDGRVLSVRRDYRDPFFGALERSLAERGQLRAVVTPGNDAAHRNHFHISATMTIDEGRPDGRVEVGQLMAEARAAHRRLARRGRPRARAAPR